MFTSISAALESRLWFTVGEPGCNLSTLISEGGAEPGSPGLSTAPLASSASVIRGKVVEYQGAHVNCWDQPLRFARVSIISDFNASVQGYSGVLTVFQFSVN